MSAPGANPPAGGKLQGVVKRFAGHVALDVDLVEFDACKVHVLVGLNGAGKTTLLRLLAGLDTPDEGAVTMLGSNPAALSGTGALSLRRRMGFAAQKPYLFRATVRRNVEYPLAVRGVPATALERLGVGHLAERPSATLSAGETQRVALARAVVSTPELLLLDEPLANVDPEGAPVIEKLVLDLASSGTTVIVATHVLEQAYHLSANVVRLEAGRLAPPGVENVLEGEVVPTGTGAALALRCGLSITVVTEARGPARAVVDPGDIVLSTHELASSARNSFPGRATELRERGGVVMVRAVVGAAPGLTLTASVTPKSCRKLGLTVGSKVVLTFKTTAVKVF